MVRDFGVPNVEKLEQRRTVSPQDARATATVSPRDGRALGAVAGRGCGRVAPRGDCPNVPDDDCSSLTQQKECGTAAAPAVLRCALGEASATASASPRAPLRTGAAAYGRRRP